MKHTRWPAQINMTAGAGKSMNGSDNMSYGPVTGPLGSWGWVEKDSRRGIIIIRQHTHMV